MWVTLDGNGRRRGDNECSSVPLGYNERCGLRSHWAPMQQKHERPSELDASTCRLFTVRPDVYPHSGVLTAVPWDVFILCVCGLSDRRTMFVGDMASKGKLFLYFNRPACLCNLNHPFSLRTSLSPFTMSAATHPSPPHLVLLCFWRKTLKGFASEGECSLSVRQMMSWIAVFYASRLKYAMFSTRRAKPFTFEKKCKESLVK